MALPRNRCRPPSMWGIGSRCSTAIALQDGRGGQAGTGRTVHRAPRRARRCVLAASRRQTPRSDRSHPRERDRDRAVMGNVREVAADRCRVQRSTPEHVDPAVSKQAQDRQRGGTRPGHEAQAEILRAERASAPERYQRREEDRLGEQHPRRGAPFASVRDLVHYDL
jgi:hypothetical protein